MSRIKSLGQFLFHFCHRKKKKNWQVYQRKTIYLLFVIPRAPLSVPPDFFFIFCCQSQGCGFMSLCCLLAAVSFWFSFLRAPFSSLQLEAAVLVGSLNLNIAAVLPLSTAVLICCVLISLRCTSLVYVSVGKINPRVFIQYDFVVLK